MNHNDKILISLTTGIAIGAILGILLSGESGCERRKKNAQVRKIVEDVLENLGKRNTKSSSLKQDMEEAVKEAFTENPEEYA